MKYAYYPGCSMEANSAAYDQSAKQVVAALGVELAEIPDWNCCGATEYTTLNRIASYSLVARNLALVEPEMDQIVAPCSACYLNLKKTEHVLCEHADVRRKVDSALEAGGLFYEPGRMRVRHLLDVIHADVGREQIQAKVTRPLNGIRIAPYYGCQIVRPMNGFDDPEYPVKLDHVLRWLGAGALDFPVKTHCCGGHMTQISEDQALELIRRLLHSAQTYEADAIACLCPMCQLNLDAYQAAVNRRFGTDFHIPVLFFTQVIGLAFGMNATELGFGRELISAAPLLEKLNVPAPDVDEADAKPKKRKKDSPELPMPRRDDLEDNHG